MDFEGAKQYIRAKLVKELPKVLTYHNLRHIEDVYEVAQFLAGVEGVPTHETQLLLTAALFHDAGFTKDRIDHEAYSIEIAKASLPGFGYSNEGVEQICGMIAATRLPQTPRTPLEKILCDADLDYLGREDFWEIGHTLFLELQHFGLVADLAEWNRRQAQFLEQHHYFTEAAMARRNAGKAHNLARVKSLITN